jgi:hypothetical protein
MPVFRIELMSVTRVSHLDRARFPPTVVEGPPGGGKTLAIGGGSAA